MSSPKHLWAGDWEQESAARRGHAPTSEAAAPVQEPVRPRPAPPRPAAPRPVTAPREAATPPATTTTAAPPPARVATPRPRRPRRSLRISRQELRRWALAGGLALVAGFIIVSLVNLVSDDHSTTSRNVAAAGVPGWMGVQARTAPGGGAVIGRMVPGGPADAAGLDPGDVIVDVDATPVNSAADLTAALSRHPPGETVAVRAMRGNSAFTAQVTLESHPTGQSGP